jgi:hypothetical protein
MANDKALAVRLMTGDTPNVRRGSKNFFTDNCRHLNFDALRSRFFVSVHTGDPVCALVRHALCVMAPQLKAPSALGRRLLK